MSKVFIEESSLTAIGDAIRAKSGETALMSPAAMVTAIENLSSGGGGEVSTMVINKNLSRFNEYARFGSWVQENAANIQTEGINQFENAFYSDTVSNDLTQLKINLGTPSGSATMAGMFNGATNLVALPTFIGTIGRSGYQYRYFFSGCNNLRHIPDNLFTEILIPQTGTMGGNTEMFNGCYRLENIPDLHLISETVSSNSSSYYPYNYAFYNCFNVREFVNLPVAGQGCVSEDGNTVYTVVSSSIFNDTFTYCFRLERLKFYGAKANGTVTNSVPTSWKNQTIDLTTAGFANESTALRYPDIFPSDKKINSDETYAALKDDSEAWTTNASWSRYTLSRVTETLNSLPNALGGSCTIKFPYWLGLGTEEGLVRDNIPSSVLSIATAKGWTVTFV